MVSFEICFNSGSTNEFSLTKGSAVQLIQINNSDESYYKDAILKVYDLGDNEGKIDINSTVKVWIDDSLEFSGYVSRIQKSVLGTRFYNLQCIGKTYDLWRFSTSSNTTYSSKKSAYIVSSLVSSYTNITPPDVSEDDGAFVKEIDLSNMSVGDAVARLSKFDGYHFYVDNDDKLQYYQPASSVQFTITDNDILSMSPIEHSDDYLRNIVLVIGSMQYELIEPSTIPTYKSGQFFYISSDTRLIAQQIDVPTNLDTSRLSSIKLLVKRSTGDNIPYYLTGDIRKDNSNVPSSAIVPSSDTISWSATDILYDVSGSWLPYYSFTSPNLELTSGNSYWIVYQYDGASTSKYWMLSYHMISSTIDDLSTDPSLSGQWDFGSIDFGKVEWSS